MGGGGGAKPVDMLLAGWGGGGAKPVDMLLGWEGWGRGDS